MEITLTHIILGEATITNQVIHLFWKKDGEPDIDYRTLPDATVNPSGLIISPSPYVFDTEGTISTDIWVKAVNACNDTFIVTKLFEGLDLCCPIGYTLSEDQTYCFQISTTPATPPSGSENAVSVSGPNNYYYGIFGSLIFDPGYNTDGTGTFTQISYANGFWVNGPGYPAYPSASNTLGPLNRAGVWSTTVLSPQTIGFTTCVTLPSNGTYYIGMACDDFAQIKVDGNIIVSQNRNALKAYLQANGYSYPIGLDPNQVTFNFWFIYPIFLTAGDHTIEVIGNNASGTITGSATLGCEIYNLTSSQIQAAVSYGDMGAGLIFSSKDFVGQPIQIGSGGIGYTCPDGYSLILCDGPAYCTRTLTTAIIACPS